MLWGFMVHGHELFFRRHNDLSTPSAIYSKKRRIQCSKHPVWETRDKNELRMINPDSSHCWHAYTSHSETSSNALYHPLTWCDTYASKLRCRFMSWCPSPYRRFGWVWKAMFHQFGNMERRPYRPARPPRYILMGQNPLPRLWRQGVKTQTGDGV